MTEDLADRYTTLGMGPTFSSSLSAFESSTDALTIN